MGGEGGSGEWGGGHLVHAGREDSGGHVRHAQPAPRLGQSSPRPVRFGVRPPHRRLQTCQARLSVSPSLSLSFRGEVCRQEVRVCRERPLLDQVVTAHRVELRSTFTEHGLEIKAWVASSQSHRIERRYRYLFRSIPCRLRSDPTTLARSDSSSSDW